MKTLVINCGSSSLKYQLIDMVEEKVLAKGLVERIGLGGALLTHQPAEQDKVKIEAEIPDHNVAIELVIKALLDRNYGVIENMSEISAVGHRVVHGAEKFIKSTLIDDEVMKTLEETIELAPLHNPPNIAGIRACQKLMPGVPQVAVFDTAFHQTIPPKAFVYGIPYELYEKYGIRRYGFHGTSHKYVSLRAADILNKKIEDLKIITCHLGNGASIAAVKHGKSVDTSMGFTPLEGLVMGTRSGDLDPAILPYLMKVMNLNAEEVNDYLNKKSGVLGISGVSSDFRDIEAAAKDGNKRAQLALDIFVYNVKKYIGSYAAVMGGVDALVFTAGLGENGVEIREKICEGLEFLGIKVDHVKNNVRGKEQIISEDNGRVKVIVIPTNEELMIARETKEIIS